VEALMGRLSGKRALVTGAASGIGRACALAMSREGAELILTDIDEAGGCETLAMIAAAGGPVCFHFHDAAGEEDWKSVLSGLDVLDVLVNNAGQCIAAPLAETSYDVWRRQLAVNLDGVFFGTKLAMPLLARSGAGSIINVSSVAGLKGIAGLSGYCASKGAVRLFTKAVALECAQSGNGVRVNSIHPGAIETPIWAKMGSGGSVPADAQLYREAMDAARAASVAATPLGRAGSANDIAAGVVFLASDESRFVTGTELVIDGGVMAG
jgi:NAD(P)-dependent dehydrogenase (short-subunit alcohol dehydrogenase family)